MNSQQRTELLEIISEQGRRYSDWRMGQLIAGWADQEIWDAEDEQLLKAAQLHLHQMKPSEVATSK
jgi:hypothetical protein